MSAESRFDCRKCASCCKAGTMISLTPNDVAFLRRSETALVCIDDSGSEEEPSLYVLTEDCGNLRFNLITKEYACAAYEDQNRPEICRDFKAGSVACRQMRRERGFIDPRLDSVDEIDPPTTGISLFNPVRN